MKHLATFCFALAPSLAHAQSFEVNINTAIMGSSDVAFDYLSHRSVMPATGIDLGFEVTEQLNVLVGLHTGTVGAMVYSDAGHDRAVVQEPYDEYEEDYYYSENGFELASTVNQLQTGLRYRFDWTRRLKLTATGQAVFAHANLRMDEDIELEGSEVAVKYTAFAPGGLVAAGIEWSPIMVGTSRINVGIEAGYSHILAFNFKEEDAGDEPIDVGGLSLNGTLLRWYIGTRF